MIQRLFVASFALLVLAVPAAQAQESEEAFRSAMIARMGKAMPDATLTPKPGDPLAIVVKAPGWDDAQINLDRIFNYCRQASADECENEKARFVAAVAEISSSEVAKPESLRLVVRDQDYIDATARMDGGNSGGKPDPLIAQPLGGGLYAVLASDSPNAVRMFTERGFKELGLTREQAWAIALRQTRPLLPPLPTAAQLKESLIVYEDHEFGAGMLIDLPAWAKLSAEVGPDLFMAVISDRFVFVGIKPDGQGFEALKKAVEEDCLSQPRCTSSRVYRFRNGRWAVAE